MTYAANQYKKLCDLASKLSSEGILECIILGTLHAPDNADPVEVAKCCKSLNVDVIQPGQWTKAKVFGTPSLDDPCGTIGNMANLLESIPICAEQQDIPGETNHMSIEYPKKCTFRRPSNQTERENALKAMALDVKKIREYLCETMKWKCWQQKAISNHKIINKQYFYYVKGVDKDYWDLQHGNNHTKLYTIWKNIGKCSIHKMAKEQLEECIRTSPVWQVQDLDDINDSPLHLQPELPQGDQDLEWPAVAQDVELPPEDLELSIQLEDQDLEWPEVAQDVELPPEDLELPLQMDLLEKCGTFGCESDPDQCPAVTILHEVPCCFPCMKKHSNSQYQTYAELPQYTKNEILLFIEKLAKAKFARTFQELLANVLSRYLNVNFDSETLKSIKWNYVYNIIAVW